MALRLVVAGKGPAYEEIKTFTDAWFVPSGQPLIPGDVLLSVQYDRIVPQKTLDGFQAAFNLHFGLLPEYRGCFPTKWSIINGDPVGVTFHYMTAGVDEGPIIARWSYPSDGITDGEAYGLCSDAAVVLWRAYLPRILAGDFPSAYEQDHRHGRYYPRRLPFDGLRANVPPDRLERAERAFTHDGYPGLK